MEEIQVETEEQILPICRRNREELIAKYHFVEMIALIYFRTDNTETINKDVQHLKKCPKCIKWLHEVTPKEIIKRQKRLSEYCCVGFFSAVEEYKQNMEARIEFTMFRGEDPCWMISKKYSFIKYCPWCGTKLPDRAF